MNVSRGLNNLFHIPLLEEYIGQLWRVYGEERNQIVLERDKFGSSEMIAYWLLINSLKTRNYFNSPQVDGKLSNPEFLCLF